MFKLCLQKIKPIIRGFDMSNATKHDNDKDLDRFMESRYNSDNVTCSLNKALTKANTNQEDYGFL